MNKKDFYRDLIVKNYTNPENLVTNQPLGYQKFTAYSKNCSELYHIFLKLEANKIIDIKFSGYGCTISKASLNIFCSMIQNQKISYVNDLVSNYKNMINKQKFDQSKVKNLIIFENVAIHENRKHCALFAINKITEKIKISS